MANIISSLYQMTPTGATTMKALKDLDEKGTKEELENIVHFWDEKSRFKKFLNYINPFRIYDWDTFAEGAKEILKKKE